MPRTGEMLADRYVVGDPIGQGRSTVYRAEDTRLRRQVAVKEVKLWASQEDAQRVRRRAMREAQAAARLTDPGVVTVFDVVEQDGSIWLVMELVDAPSLSGLIVDGGPIDHRRAARIGLDVLDALRAAHEVGIVHRDVKPANVLVAPGRTRLTDFGVATIRDESRLTSIGTIVGSPSYMAPEQARGEQVGPGADLWALGATLYFAVEGRAPFEGDSPIATASAVVHADPRPQQHPGALSGLLARLLVKDPADRPDVSTIRAALASAAELEPVPRPPADDDLTLVGAPLLAPDESGQATAPAPAVVDDEDEGDGGEPADEAPAPAAPPDEPEPAAAAAPAPEAPAPDRPPEPSPDGRRSLPSTRPVAVAAAAVVTVAGMAAASLWLGGDDDGGGGGGSGGGADTTTAVTAAAGEGTATEGSSTTATTAAPSEEGGIPDGWREYTDPAGTYRIAHPPGWQVVRPSEDNPNRYDFRDPETGSYLRVEWVQPPTGRDPAEVWRENAQDFAASHDAYEQLRIEPFEYRDYPAGLWEFRYTDGVRLHVANLGFIAEGRGYALYFQTHEENWNGSQDLLQQFRQTFQPAPAG